MQTPFSHVTEDTREGSVCLHVNDRPVSPARSSLFALNKVTICHVSMRNTEIPKTEFFFSFLFFSILKSLFRTLTRSGVNHRKTSKAQTAAGG